MDQESESTLLTDGVVPVTDNGRNAFRIDLPSPERREKRIFASRVLVETPTGFRRETVALALNDNGDFVVVGRVANPPTKLKKENI
jgi:hypothetical protein